MKKNINDDNNGKIKKQSYSRLWFKKALKNIAVGAISVGVVAGAIFGFAGCGNTNTPTPTPPDIDPNPPIITPQPGDEEIKNVDFSEFLSTPAYKQEGINFFNEVIKPQITSGKGEVLAETINFDSTDESSLDNVSYAYVYKTGETSRKYDVVNVQFSPIKFDDILNDKVNNNNVVPIIQTTLSFDFDAKENVNKSDLMDAVYSRMRHYSSSLDSDATTYFGDVSSRMDSGYKVLKYNILAEKDNKISVNSMEFYEKDLDEAGFIEHLKDDNKFDDIAYEYRVYSKNYNLNGENVFRKDYTAEYQKENPGPGTDTGKEIESVEDLVTNHATELNQGLQGAYDHMVENVFPNRVNDFDETKISETKWNLDTDENGAVSKLNYYGKYDNRVFFVASVDLKSPINIKDLTDKNVVSELQKATNGATYNFEVQFNYNKEAMTQYDGVAEAIFNQEGLKEDNAKYYISSVRPSLGELGNNTIIASILQVSSKGVKQMAIEVRDDDKGFDYNITEGFYKTSNKTSYDFGEYTLNAETNKVAKTSYSLYNEETGKYNIEDFGDDLLFN